MDTCTPLGGIEGKAVKFSEGRSYRNGQSIVAQAGMLHFAQGLVNAPEIVVRPGCSPAIKEHVASRLRDKGCAMPVKVDPGFGPDLNAWHPGTRLVFQVQTGNIVRAFYDLVKMQSLYQQGRAVGAILILPSREAAPRMGGNLANFERVVEELEFLYSDQFTVPAYLVAFE